MITAAWLAGILDGEGSITRRSVVTNRGVVISITQKQRERCEAIRDFLGYGRVIGGQGPSGTTHRIRVEAIHEVRHFIGLVYPYVVWKRDQLDIAIKIMDLPLGSRDEAVRLQQELKQLKQGEPQSMESVQCP